MPSLLDPATRASVVERLHRLQPDATPRWGRMTAPQMLAHLSDSFRMAMGQLPIKSRNIWFAQRFPAKHIFLYVMPFPKGAPSAKELTTRPPLPFEEERATVVRLMEQMAAQGPATTAEHAIFGRLTHKEWSVLGHKHVDHHLRQFGV